MLGDFLEISIECEDILASIGFYEKLGFMQASTGDAWPHPYAVLTDGRCSIGLHQYRFPSPSLTFARPRLRDQIPLLEAVGIDFSFAKLGAEEFNEAGFYTPDGQMVCLLEARTFSPLLPRPSLCGWFEGWRLPVRSRAPAVRFWERLGFVRGLDGHVPSGETPVSGGGLTLCLAETQNPDRPQLVFEHARPAELADELRSREIAVRTPEAGTLALQAPEGTNLLIRRHDPETAG